MYCLLQCLWARPTFAIFNEVSFQLPTKGEATNHNRFAKLVIADHQTTDVAAVVVVDPPPALGVRDDSDDDVGGAP